MNDSQLHYRTYLILLVIVTLAFGWLLLPYYGAIFWGAVLAISFMPLHRRLRARLGTRPGLSAFLTVLLCLLLVILPVTLLAGSLLQEGSNLYKRVESGDLNLGAYFEQIVSALPPSIHNALEQFGLTDLFSIQEKVSAGALQGSKFLASQAVNIGQNTFQFLIGLGIMLYLLFFLLRDGPQLARTIFHVIPLSGEHKQMLIHKFVTVVRATLKGNIVVAATQGALGGLIFWILGIEGALLWAVIMAVLSLLPAVGAAIIWLPVAIYFLVTGEIWIGIVLIAYGILVIGLVDNILRPLLVGKDTKMPDYVVLISTIGGLTLFGLNGFVIGPLIAALFMSVWALFPSAAEQQNPASGLSEAQPGPTTLAAAKHPPNIF